MTDGAVDPGADVEPADVRAAASLLAGRVHHTPVITSRSIDEWVGTRVFLKAENLQRVGAFKFRGALHAVLRLTAVPDVPVAAHSSGNHAQALALAARECGRRAVVVMPSDAPRAKRDATAALGAEIVTCDPGVTAREAALAEVLDRTGALEIHPFDDPRVIAGAGTAAHELLRRVDGLDAIVAPIGGGGLLSGTALAAAGSTGAVRPAVWGAEPSAADDAYRSLAAGRLIPVEAPATIADGLRTSLRPRTFALVSRLAEGIVRVDEDEIIEAMWLVWERTKLVIEPSAAVAVAGARRLVHDSAAPPARLGVILSGGNVDLGALPWAPK